MTEMTQKLLFLFVYVNEHTGEVKAMAMQGTEKIPDDALSEIGSDWVDAVSILGNLGWEMAGMIGRGVPSIHTIRVEDDTEIKPEQDEFVYIMRKHIISK